MESIMRTVTVYTLAELKSEHPAGYARVLRRWETRCEQDTTPWVDEIVNSYKAVVAACGAKLEDWEFGAYSCPYVSIDVPEELDNNREAFDETLKTLGYWKDGAPHFPGLCKFTGYCADDDILEAVSNAFQGGESLRYALMKGASKTAKLIDADADAWKDEENMEANWDRREYLADGTEV